MGTRRDVQTSQADRDAYVRGCVLLSREMTGITAAQINQQIGPQVPGWQMRGDGSVEVSRWDLYALWHYVTMSLATGGQRSNRAHGGSIFLPWHRLFLLRLEQDLQRVLGQPGFGLPYWDWAEDRDLGSTLWRADRLGVNRGAVTAGPIGALRIRLSQPIDPRVGSYLGAHQPRAIARDAGRGTLGLPTKADVARCVLEASYDHPPFDAGSQGPDGEPGFRNLLEGWATPPAGFHNAVHVWVGGDMSPGTSPNDPVFFLNHCNVDRIWEAWMTRGGRTYRPLGTGPGGSHPGHNLHDPMVALLGETLTPADVLDPGQWYAYDDLDVEL